jgi:hypothetical protein
MSIARNIYDTKVINDKLDCHHIRVNKITKFYKRLILFARYATVVKVPNPEKNVCLYLGSVYLATSYACHQLFGYTGNDYVYLYLHIYAYIYVYMLRTSMLLRSCKYQKEVLHPCYPYFGTSVSQVVITLLYAFM